VRPEFLRDEWQFAIDIGPLLPIFIKEKLDAFLQNLQKLLSSCIKY
jgi:hypothetical protein